MPEVEGQSSPITAYETVRLAEFRTLDVRAANGCNRDAAELVIMMRIEITQSCLWPTTRSIPIGVIGWPSSRLNSL